jgi:hypothetical protein
LKALETQAPSNLVPLPTLYWEIANREKSAKPIRAGQSPPENGSMHFRLTRLRSMPRRARLQTLDLLFDVQFSPLQVGQYDIIGRRMGHGFRDFMLEGSVFSNELLKMRFNRHVYFSLW